MITREVPMGEVCMIPAGLECCLGQRQSCSARPGARWTGHFSCMHCKYRRANQLAERGDGFHRQPADSMLEF